MKKALSLLLMLSLASAASAQIYQVVREKFHNAFKGKMPVYISLISTYYKPAPVFTSTTPGQKNKYRHEFTFDKAGMITSTLIYNADGVLTDKQVFENDTSRKLVLSSIRNHYTSLPNLIDTITTTYDLNGFVVKQVARSGELVTILEYTVDDKGFPLTSRTTDGKGNFQTSETAFYNHAENYMIVTARDKDGKVLNCDTSKIDFSKPYGTYKAKEKYNQYGDCISYRTKNRDGSFVYKQAEYVYDIHGNWISMKWYVINKKSSGAESRQLDADYSRDILYQ